MSLSERNEYEVWGELLARLDDIEQRLADLEHGLLLLAPAVGAAGWTPELQEVLDRIRMHE